MMMLYKGAWDGAWKEMMNSDIIPDKMNTKNSNEYTVMNR